MNPTHANRPDEAAAQWALRLDAGRLSPAEERDLDFWLAEDPGNESRLENFRTTWRGLGETVPAMVREGRLPDFGAAPRVVRPPRAVFFRVAASVGVAAALALSVVWWVQRPQTLATAVAQRQAVLLADGSHVDLNARTSLAVELRGNERRVRMDEGEAYFAVAKDPSRPFFVATPAGTVRVTGTAFNVRSTAAGQLEVTVLEGSVAVEPKGHEPRQLVAQDQLTVRGASSATRQLTAPAARDVIAWREGRLIAESEKLAAAVERFARYHGREIQVEAPAADLELGGRFRLEDLESFLRDIQVALPVQVLRPADGRIRIVGR
jgi:transmembrane sensor